MSSSWKEKVADRLSRLLADSSSHRYAAEAAASDTPLDPRDSGQQQQTVPLWSDELSPPKKSPATSFFLSLLPTSRFVRDGHKSDADSTPHKTIPLPLGSPPTRWKPNGNLWKHRPMDPNLESTTESESDDAIEPKENTHHVSEKAVSGSNIIEEVCMSDDSKELVPCLSDKSTFISPHLLEFLQSCLPNIIKGCRWILLYSTLKHGISLRTLLRKSTSLPGFCLLIVGDTQGAVFGGLLESPLKPTAKRKYQGTSQTFVFTTRYGDPRLFKATGANRYYYLCLSDVLAFGGGGSFALLLDEDLLHGTSGPCETFGNSCLAHSKEFELKNVELWGFAHTSRMLHDQTE